MRTILLALALLSLTACADVTVTAPPGCAMVITQWPAGFAIKNGQWVVDSTAVAHRDTTGGFCVNSRPDSAGR